MSALAKLCAGAFLLAAITVGVANPAQATSCPATGSGVVDNGDYTVCHFEGFNFTGLTRTGIDFSTAILSNANFSGSTFTSTDFGNANSPNVNFRGAHITSGRFSLAAMSGSDFTGADLQNTALFFPHFESANFENVNFSGVTFTNVFLAGANLTGSNVTQAQLDNAVLSEETICPDGYPLGLHVDNCFSALKPLTPVLSPLTATPDGFTFDVTNYKEYYTFTVTVIAGPGVATAASPSGSKLPVVVTGVPSGSQVTVAVTATIGPVSSTTTTEYPAHLADTGVVPSNGSALQLSTVLLLVAGLTTLFFARSPRRTAHRNVG